MWPAVLTDAVLCAFVLGPRMADLSLALPKDRHLPSRSMLPSIADWCSCHPGDRRCLAAQAPANGLAAGVSRPRQQAGRGHGGRRRRDRMCPSSAPGSGNIAAKRRRRVTRFHRMGSVKAQWLKRALIKCAPTTRTQPPNSPQRSPCCRLDAPSVAA